MKAADLSTSPKLKDLEIADIPGFIEKQREFFKTGATKSYEFRKTQLLALKRLLVENQEQIIDALEKDMSRPPYEGYGADIGIVLAEVNYVLKRLKKWMKPTKVRPGLAFFKASSYVEKMPFGVTLIVSSWNYPIFTLFRPLVYALAAGNTAILKPSELSVNTSKLIDVMIDEYYDDAIVEVIPGGPETGQTMLQQNFDLIMFTGSTRIGKLYAEAAAKTFTPIILEMGGKSPTIVDKSANLKISVNRMLTGAFFNAAQTCIATDYALVHEDIIDEFIELFKASLAKAFGQQPKDSDSFGRIINIGHFNRIKAIFDDVEDKVIHGGELDADRLYISPTLVLEPSLDSKIMTEEIFGPLLPILTFSSIDDIRGIVDLNPDPLAMYIFATDKKFINAVQSTIRSGDMNVNDTMLHGAVSGLKFGGIGQSGMGGYGGKYGFDQCSHHRSVFIRSNLVHHSFTLPPYTPFKTKLLRWLLR